MMNGRAHPLFSRLALVSFSAAFAGIAAASEPSQSEIMTQLASHHVVPEYLCVAGVAPQQIDDVVIHAAAEIDENWDAWTAVESRLETANLALFTAKAIAALPSATTQDQADLAAAEAEFAAATIAKQNEFNAIGTEIRAILTGDIAAAFATVVDNRNRGVPLEYLVLDMPAEDWLDLRSALGEVNTVEEDEDPSSQATQLLSGYDSQYSVSLARVRLDSYLAQSQSVFMSTLFSLD